MARPRTSAELSARAARPDNRALFLSRPRPARTEWFPSTCIRTSADPISCPPVSCRLPCVVLALFQQRPSDRHHLNFIRAAADLQELGVARELLDMKLAHVAVP